jgi:hypothetical protein
MYDCTEEFVTKYLKIEQVAYGRFPTLKLHVKVTISSRKLNFWQKHFLHWS